MDQVKAQLKKVVGIQVFRSFFSCKVHAQASNLYMFYWIWFHNFILEDYNIMPQLFHLCLSL